MTRFSQRARLLVAPLGFAALFGVVVACGELKSASDDAAGERLPSSGGSNGTSSGAGEDAGASSSSSGGSGSSTSSSSTSSGGSSGAPNVWASLGQGPLGPYPSGVCCTKNTDCRSGYCVTAQDQEPGTIDMCADTCSGSATSCDTRLPDGGFPNGLGRFLCAPASNVSVCALAPGEPFRCKSQSSYVVGTKPLGACCTASDDLVSGMECASGVCVAAGAGPGFCSRTCSAAADCPTGYTCAGAPRGKCVPTSGPSTCN